MSRPPRRPAAPTAVFRHEGAAWSSPSRQAPQGLEGLEGLEADDVNPDYTVLDMQFQSRNLVAMMLKRLNIFVEERNLRDPTRPFALEEEKIKLEREKFEFERDLEEERILGLDMSNMSYRLQQYYERREDEIFARRCGC